MTTVTPRAAQGTSATDAWTTVDATELYDIDRWGNGYFSIGENGHVLVHPTKERERAIDLKELMDRLQMRGITLPILVRFPDILKHRLGDIHEAFQGAIQQHQYTGRYTCVYPIKVNQQRQVVEEVLQFGRPYNFGIEAGSKPELMAVAALASNDMPVICNGFKDAEFIEMAMLAQKIGRNIIPVVEKYTELGLILEYAEKVGVRPQIGFRVKLAARGSGRWQSSGATARSSGSRSPRSCAGSRNSRREACRTASSSCISTSAARSRTSASSRGRWSRRPASTANCTRLAPGSSTWMSAAVSAWTTTARRPTSSRA